MGRFDYELTYKEFKVLGAKKYAYTDEKNPSYVHIVVAGLPKKRNTESEKEESYLNTIDDFKPGVDFSKLQACKSLY